jgi:hypothetical protein
LDRAVGPRRRFVRGDDPRAAQLLTDRARRCGHVLTHAPEDVGDSAFGDGQAEHLGRKPRQTLEPDMMAVVQVGEQ